MMPPSYKHHTSIWYLSCAESGDATAQFNLGAMYYFGNGIPQDWQQAYYWYRKAAEQGHTQAQHSLGLMYRRGEGVLKDYKQAAIWYHKAAEQGDARAQYWLGVHYLLGMSEFGEGIHQSYIRSYVWSSVAVQNGYEAAIDMQNWALKKLNSEEIREANTLAREYFEKYQL